MNRGFWSKLPRPFFALAPMADVTDAAFRRLVAKYGKPDVMWTEFVSADGLCSPGRERLLRDLAFQAKERPIVAQIFGARPENIRRAAETVRELGFDGLDINMGCPQRNIESQGAGAALMRKPALAVEIIRAAKAGAGKMPVSVKTRIGYRANELKAWLPRLLEAEPAAITIHGRTRNEMSRVPARWDAIAEGVELVHRLAGRKRPLVLGNGDCRDIEDARRKAEESGVDGVMLGRAVFGNPWLFRPPRRTPDLADKAKVLLEHTQLFERLFRDTKNFALLKKHYKCYLHGFRGARRLRAYLMAANGCPEVERVMRKFMAEMV